MSRVKYLFDEDLNGRIVRGVRRRISDLDSRTVPETNLPQATDPAVLDWAADQGRVVITHDHRTMRSCAEDRLRAGRPMAGLILVPQTAPPGQVIDDFGPHRRSHYRRRVAGDNRFFAPLRSLFIINCDGRNLNNLRALFAEMS